MSIFPVVIGPCAERRTFVLSGSNRGRLQRSRSCDRRSQSCRLFDCHWQVLLGYRHPNDPIMDAALDRWKAFTTPLSEDRDAVLAVRLACMEGGPPASVEEALRKASGWGSFMERAQRLRQRSESRHALRSQASLP